MTLRRSWGRNGVPLGWILLLATVLRVAVACWPAFNHLDELWQYLEPARHVAGRPWIATWEMRGGARGWLLPMLFAAPMTLGQQLAPGSVLPVLLSRLVCVAVSLLAVIAAAGLGARLSRAHALLAAFVAATWRELVYFGAHTLSEPVATALLLAAAWLLHERRLRPLLAAGVLIGLAGAARFQYAPAAFVLAAWVLRGDVRGWAAVVASGVAGLAIAALADVAMGAVPFAWVVRNLSLNLVANRSANYGTSPWWWYAVALWRTWGPAGVPILLLAAVGARRFPAIAAAAIVNLAIHALIPHKEPRFILLSTGFAVVLAAIGTVDAAAWWRDRGHRGPTVRALAAVWLAVSILGAPFVPGWGRFRGLAVAWRSVAQVPRLCGVGIHRTLPLVASRALLARDVPIYQYDAASAAAARSSRAFDVLVVARAHRGALPGFRDRGCSGDKPQDLCVAVRTGGCTIRPEDARFRIEAVLPRLDV